MRKAVTEIIEEADRNLEEVLSIARELEVIALEMRVWALGQPTAPPKIDETGFVAPKLETSRISWN